MANTREIKSHMESVRDTQKITNAMYLIASTKLRKARGELELTRPFFYAVQKEIKRVFRISEDVDSRYFYPPQGEEPLNGTYGCLVITADKGLAGAYNQNVIRRAEEFLAEHGDTKLFVVGEYGRQYFGQHHIPIEKSFLYTAQNPTMERAREITSHLLELYDEKKLEKIYVIYTDWKNGMTEEALMTRLLPFHRSQFTSSTEEKAVRTLFRFLPSVADILDAMIPSYVAGYIYSALVDSFCSEQNARMTAMSSANENAEKMIAMLSLEYNRVRQAAITQEITEVASGAKAQKRKKEVALK